MNDTSAMPTRSSSGTALPARNGRSIRPTWTAISTMRPRASCGFAAAKPGERVLDIGCGAGQTTFLLADAVGPNGRVTGVDISTPLLGRRGAGAPKNVEFVKADAAFHPFKPEYDLIFSRFGVMFFDDPPAAFTNIRKGLKPGGRLAFVCWRPVADNAVGDAAGAGRQAVPAAAAAARSAGAGAVRLRRPGACRDHPHQGAVSAPCASRSSTAPWAWAHRPTRPRSR